MAAKKKDFKTPFTAQQTPLAQVIATATAEPEAPAAAAPVEDELQEARLQMRTQGRKGMKAIRINMQFTPDNHEYMKVMAAIRGESITQFVNHVLREHAAANADMYETAKKIKEST